MKWTRRLRAKPAILLLYGGSALALGGCLPENYFGTLFSRLTTNAADFAVQILVGAAVNAALPPGSAPVGSVLTP